MPALVLALTFAITGLLHAVSAQGGTPIPISLYTDIECETPSALHSNASIALGVCAVTPGLGSVDLNPFPCTSGDVKVWAFSDTACGKQDDIFILGSNCFGRANSGAYAAIMLSCDADEPGQPTATTTIQVGSVATGGPAPTSTQDAGGTSGSSGSTSPSSSPSESSSSSSSSSSSGWDGLSVGAKAGIIVGAIAAVAAGGITMKCVFNCSRHRSEMTSPTNHAPGSQEMLKGPYGRPAMSPRGQQSDSAPEWSYR